MNKPEKENSEESKPKHYLSNDKYADLVIWLAANKPNLDGKFTIAELCKKSEKAINVEIVSPSTLKKACKRLGISSKHSSPSTGKAVRYAHHTERALRILCYEILSIQKDLGVTRSQSFQTLIEDLTSRSNDNDEEEGDSVVSN